MPNIIFIHGLESSGHEFKGRLLKSAIPGILTPDFKEFDKKILIYDLFEYRMRELRSILKEKTPWTLIGSSLGGLMAAIAALEDPNKVCQLVLLAPFLLSRKLKPRMYKPIDIPVIAYHGKNDTVVRYKMARERAKIFFTNLKYNIVDDDHKLKSTVKSIDWQKLILNP